MAERTPPDKTETESLSNQSNTGNVNGGAQTTPSPMLPGDGADLLLGAQLGNYQITQRLGKGGFGVVYKARDVELGRDVALKFLRHQRGLDPLHRHLFAREAKVLAALAKHRSIVQIYSWGEHNQENYFALEFVASSAQDLLRQPPGRLPVERALEIAAETAEALAYAHKRKVLHRDVKPANILIEAEDGRVKVADFGLARFCDRGELSISGSVSGSPPYMSPEQARGTTLDERSDICSLGLTLYELLSGRRCYDGDTASEIIERICRDERVPLGKRMPELPKEVLAIVDKATAHDPALRYQSAEEMAVDLRNVYRIITGQKMKLPAPRRKRALGIWAAAVMAAALAAMLVWRGGEPDKDLLGTPLVTAATLMDAGEAQKAEPLYREFLQQNPNNAEGLYGLGYALLEQGQTDEALAQFQQITHEAPKAEGVAAVEYETEGADARGALESARTKVDTAYIDTLLALLSLADHQYPDVVERLGDVDRERFHFTWQYAKCLQSLGQAYFHLGRLQEAEGTFRELETIAPEQSKPVIAVYLARTKRRMDQEYRQEVRETAGRVSQLMNTREAPPTPENIWTSRPLSFFLLPPEGRSGRIAAESGLADALPWLLGPALDGQPRMELVEREHILDVLAEQELSAQLGDPKLRLALGQLVPARFFIACTFGALRGSEFIHTTIVDTTTTRQLPLTRIEIGRHIDPDALVEQVSTLIRNRLVEEYPIHGMLAVGANGPELNIGTPVGVAAGMRFGVTDGPGNPLLADHAVIVLDAVGPERALVRLEGFEPGDIPEKGWYAVEQNGRERNAKEE